VKKIKNLIINTLLVSVATFGISGCSTIQESFSSQMEVPTLENQANRVAIGMTIVRENNLMAFKMPISADAKWPAMVAAEIDDKEKKFIDSALMDEPYFSTMHYTKPIQRKMLGSGALMSQLGDYGQLTAMVLDASVSPLTYRAFHKLSIFYGKDEANWPNIFNYNSSLSNFLDFKDGKMIEIDSPTGDVYDTIGEAVISLTPINMQKDLSVARGDMLDAYNEVAFLKGEKGEYETQLKSDKPKLSSRQKLEIRGNLTLSEEKIKAAESIAQEKEAIYFQLLDQAVVALESDISLDKNYVKLAKNLNIVSNEIQVSATEAYASFSLALANMAANNTLAKFPKELESLAIAKAYVPMRLQSKYNKRVARLVKNALYLLPNIFIGTYYAHKQSVLAEKYESVTDIILLASEAKKEQDSAAAKAKTAR